MFPALLTTLLFALTAVCATQAAGALGPVRANFYRLLIATLLLGAWSHSFGGGWGGSGISTFAVAGAVGFGGGGLCMFRAFPLIGSTLSLLVVECASAMASAILAWHFLDAHLTLGQIGFALLALSGVAIGLVPFRLPEVPRRTLLLGVMFAGLASIAQGISWTLSKYAFNRIADTGGSLDGLTAAYQRLLGGIAVATVAFLIVRLSAGVERRHGAIDPPRKAIPGAGWWVMGNALAGPVLGVSCMLWAIHTLENPGLAQSVVATATLVSVPFARRLEQRTLGLQYFIGAGISIVGLVGLLLNVVVI